MVKMAGGPFEIVPDANGVIPFDKYMQIFTVTVRLSIRFFNESNVKHKAERRALLQAKKEKEYQLKCQENMKRATIIRQTISQEVNKAFGIGAQIYNATSLYYKRNPAFAQQLAMGAQRAESVERKAQGTQELELEETLKYIRQIEEAKVDSQVANKLALTMKKITEAQVLPL